MSKNIHDLSDDEFDDLFRDSAEKSDIGFDPGAWNKMSQKLDAATTPPSSPGKGGNPLTKWGLPAVVVLLLLITGTYFFLRKPSGAVTETKVKAKVGSVNQTEKVGEKDVATDKVGTENKEKAKENSILNDKVDTDKVIVPDSKISTKKTNEALKPIDNSKVEKAVSSKTKQNLDNSKVNLAKETKSVKQEKALSSQDEQQAKIADTNKGKVNKSTRQSSDDLAPANDANTAIAKDGAEATNQSFAVAERKGDNAKFTIKNSKQQSLVGKNRAASNQTPSVKNDNNSSANGVNNDLKTTAQGQVLVVDSVNTIEKMQWAPVHVLSPNKHLFTINLKLPEVSFESPALAPVAIPRANTAFRRGLNIRLALSPDFSFIPSNKIFKVGNNWAAILEYRFNNRLSLQTGVIRSMKYYGALPNQYEWNAYWTMPSPLKDIDATCKMLDIPLNVRYDLSQKPNSRWFVGAGFTSYIMLKEEYRYNYENPSDPNIKRTSWEGKTGGYPFSVLNLSAGYERQLFRRLTFQAEPFYKAPLGKVGYGKVRLATAGVFFSVKYPF